MLDSTHIGRIEIYDDYSMVDLPQGMPRDLFRMVDLPQGMPRDLFRALKKV
jgi:hypothetical protein